MYRPQMLHDSLPPFKQPRDQAQTSQRYSPVNRFNIDEDTNPFFCSQYYSTNQGSNSPSLPVEDDDPVEEATPVKMASRRHQKSKTSEKDDATEITTLKQNYWKTDAGYNFVEQTAWELYKLGARKIGVSTLPPIGCLPASITIFGEDSNACVDKMNKVAEYFNKNLNATSLTLKSKLSGLNLVVLDIYKPLYELVQKPTDYGFFEARKACCGTGLVETSFLCNISLIGCQYKIVGKILANRLSLVIGDIVSQEQSAFIKERQIMDGPLILNEVISWCNARKEQLLMFKVDFQKALDSVRWDHLDDIIGKEGYDKAIPFLLSFLSSPWRVCMFLFNGSSIEEKFKRLFNLELQKDANLASKLQASNVASFFRRPPRSDGGTFIFLSLMIHLHGIPGSTCPEPSASLLRSIPAEAYAEATRLTNILQSRVTH
nr:GDSL esterase/lipase At5g22810-like [Tanacetum cinerariifolium]